jgi:hypothetical protein
MLVASAHPSAAEATSDSDRSAVHYVYKRADVPAPDTAVRYWRSTILRKYFLRWMIPSFSIYNQTYAKEYHPILFILDKV